MSAGEIDRRTPGGSGGLLLDVGRTLDWHSAGYGTYLDDVPHVTATREVVSVPGGGEVDLQGAGSTAEHMRAVSQRLIASAAFTPDCHSLELRYVAVPRAGQPTRLRMFITAKVLGTSAGTANAIVGAACAALPPGFDTAVPSDPPGSRSDGGWHSDTVLELHRLEEITMPQWNFIPTEFYYTLNDEPGDGSGWAAFWSYLARVGRPAEISILLRATELDPVERDVLGRITSELARYGSPHNDYDVFGNQTEYPADTNAEVALTRWQRRIEQWQRPLLGRVAVRAEPETAYAVATALATAIGASRAQGYESQPMHVDSPGVGTHAEKLAFEAFASREIFPWGGIQLWEMEEAPRLLRRLPYLFGLREAAGLALLPVPDEQGVPGFARSRRNAGRRAGTSAAEVAGPSVRLGQLLHQGALAGELRLPVSALLRHTLVVGASGSGKTTTVHTLLAELWREHGVPFMAIEPTKTEYRGLLEMPGLHELEVIVLGRDDISPLRLNPLEPPPGVRCEVHCGAVLSALKLALPLFPPLPQLLGEALERTYRLAGWDYDTTLEDGIRAPTLRSLLASFELVFEQEGYVGEARNLGTAMRVRLKSLLQGSRGRVFDTVQSTDFAALMQRPVVFELDALSDGEDKAVAAAFILERIRATARARVGIGGTLEHVTVIEEAHRLLPRAEEGRRDGSGGDNTRSDATRAFCEAIRELRAQGEGFVLSSQRPADLALAAVATTSTRVLHRLETAADRKDVLDDIDASEIDREAAARLRAGEAITRWADQDDAELVRVEAASGVDTSRKVSDADVARAMASRTRATRKLLPYALCTPEMCPNGCEPPVRNEGELLAADTGPQAQQLWAEHQATTGALDPVARLLVAEAEGHAQLAYCGAAHLAATGDALRVRRRQDIRPQVAAAIRRLTEER